MIFIKILIISLCIALSVGFYTLLERKILSYIQVRKGPNKVSLGGIPQPLADAIKLFLKEGLKINLSIRISYLLSPIVAMVIMLILWSLYFSDSSLVSFKLGVLFFFAVSSLNVFVILISGWSSNRKYALLGATRGVAQTISYEVSMSLVLFIVLISKKSFDFFEIRDFNFFYLPFVGLLWFITCLSERNRAPFDLAEGESELVSGFNIEYGRASFAFLFIAEYGRVLLLSIVTASLFFCSWLSSSGSSIIFWSIVSTLFLWVRGTFPRMRYDSLISLTWKTFLRLSLGFGFLMFI